MLLCMDILKGMDGKPADIILSQNKIVLNGQEINCQHYPQICNRRVRAAENNQIQGHTEQIIDRYESDDCLLTSDFIVEPSQSFKENLPLVMASCLVDINYAQTVNVRIMNFFPTNANIKAETIINTAEILTNPPQNFQACENEHEEGNSGSAPRLQFSHPQDNLLGNVSTVKAQNSAPTEVITTENQFSHLSSEKQEDVPPHLQKLYGVLRRKVTKSNSKKTTV